MRIYIDNLPEKITEDILQKTFEVYGDINKIEIERDHKTGRPKGFAFVEMADSTQAKMAIENLNGKPILGQPLIISVARAGVRDRRRPGRTGGRRLTDPPAMKS